MARRLWLSSGRRLSEGEASGSLGHMSVTTRYAHLSPDHLESALRLSPLAQQKLTALDQNK
ncbi:hypothetical protein B6N17_017485 [Stutzerimonas stutzeri]|nr:hypothetical protein B6N17_017485 [Stutzerimonas stutzeri]OWG35949.1 hypothetical protein CAQ69_23555 [Stutzerimonas stutzeri]RRW23839.1 hypothetical protein EGJ47_19645 [Stutzerimonas stutzeri]